MGTNDIDPIHQNQSCVTDANTPVDHNVPVDEFNYNKCS